VAEASMSFAPHLGLTTFILSAAGATVATAPLLAIVLALIPALGGIIAAFIASGWRNRRNNSHNLRDDEIVVTRAEWERLNRRNQFDD
jgi:hypothetical protein